MGEICHFHTNTPTQSSKKATKHGYQCKAQLLTTMWARRNRGGGLVCFVALVGLLSVGDETFNGDGGHCRCNALHTHNEMYTHYAHTQCTLTMNTYNGVVHFQPTPHPPSLKGQGGGHTPCNFNTPCKLTSCKRVLIDSIVRSSSSTLRNGALRRFHHSAPQTFFYPHTEIEIDIVWRSPNAANGEHLY